MPSALIPVQNLGVFRRAWALMQASMILPELFLVANFG
jgi:hypothetical protein